MRVDGFRIFSIEREKISNDISEVTRQLCETTFSEKRENYTYKENYLWDEHDSKTLAYKFKNKQFDMINFVFQNDNFISFSGFYVNRHGISFGGVRRFATKESPLQPYHLAYVAPLQYDLAKSMKARAFVLSYNHGVRDKYFLRVKRIVYGDSKSKTNLIAQKFFKENNFQMQESPVICNTTLQRLHYGIIDPTLSKEEFLLLLQQI